MLTPSGGGSFGAVRTPGLVVLANLAQTAKFGASALDLFSATTTSTERRTN